MDDAAGAVPKATIPQQDRSRLTRQRILDAAVELLADSGYEGFTTGLVSERAGVSKGGLFKHFPARESLLAATVEHVFERQRGRFAVALGEIRGVSARDRVRALLGALLEVLRDPEYLAVLQVYGAARTNPRLASVLLPIAEAAAAETNRSGAALLADLGVPTDAHLSGLFTVLFYALEGMAQDEKLSGESARCVQDDALWHLERLVMGVIPDPQRSGG